MSSVTPRARARVSLAVFSAMLLMQISGLTASLEHLAGAFPTHFHRAEAAFLLVILFTCVITASFGSDGYARFAHIILGALAFYSLAKLLSTYGSHDAPMHAQAIIGTHRIIVTSLLFWILSGATTCRWFSWKEAFYSLTLANFGYAYLKVIPLFSFG